MNQSELEENTCNPRQARGNACAQVTVSFSFTYDWLRKRCKVFSTISESGKTKPKQTRNICDTWLRTAPCNFLALPTPPTNKRKWSWSAGWVDPFRPKDPLRFDPTVQEHQQLRTRESPAVVCLHRIVAQIGITNLPTQAEVPLASTYPSPQIHSNEPGVLRQTPLLQSVGSFWHSSTSAKNKELQSCNFWKNE